MRKFFIIFLVFSLVLPLAYAKGKMSKSRSIKLDYEVAIKDIPPDTAELKIWLPYPPQTPYQKVETVTVSPEVPALFTYDNTYHNKIIYGYFKSPPDSVDIKVSYKIRRYEYSNYLKGLHTKPNLDEDLTKYLISNKLMVVSSDIKKMADDITKGKSTTMEKARAIYDYVFQNVSYDKTIPGWGRGDTKRVCIIKAGNCSDFHSLFVSLARACGIPAKFVMGFSIPKEREGEIKTYHCWAEFYDRQLGWVPVDVSEAWKDKSKKEYYFGNLNEHRIEFSQGRDIVLEPPARSEPLNYFIYPYVEIDGKNFKDVKCLFRFKDRPIEGGEDELDEG